MKKFLSSLMAIVLAFGTVGFTACKDKQDGSDDSSSSSSGNVAETEYTVSLSQSACTVTEDSTVTLTATVEPNASVKWTTSDKSVVSLDATANEVTVLAKSEGTATVTATIGSASASCAVTVLPSDGVFVTLESDVPEYNLEIGGASVPVSFTAYTVTLDGVKTPIHDAEIIYEVNEEQLSRGFLSFEDGELTGLKRGSSEISAKYVSEEYGTLTAYADITIYNKFISNAAEWKAMLADRTLNTSYMLDADIDFSGETYTGAYTGSPTTETKNAFRGTLEGNGHVVKNVTLNSTNSTYQSLFGLVNNGKISNVAFENVGVTGGGRAAGLSTSLVGVSASISNVSLELIYSEEPYASAVLLNTYNGGVLRNILATVDTPNDNATEDNVSVICSGTPTVENVYVLAEGAIVTKGKIAAYVSKIDMAFEINPQKPFPSDCWQYYGGTALPALIKK